MIKFPKVHIATSVVNRILNAHDEIESQTARPAEPIDPVRAEGPAVPATTDTSEGLDAVLRAPPAPSDADPVLAEDIATASLL